MSIAALTRPRVVMGLMFFPRGGSAQVARGLAHVLTGQRWDVTIVSGSLRLPGRPGDALLFFSGLDVSPVDYTAALSSADPLRAESPPHPTGSSPPSMTLPTSIWSPTGRGYCARRVPPQPTSSTSITSLRSTKLLH